MSNVFNDISNKINDIVSFHNSYLDSDDDIISIDNLDDENVNDQDNQNLDNQNLDNQDLDNQNLDNQNLDNQDLDNQDFDNQDFDNQDFEIFYLDNEVLEINYEEKHLVKKQRIN